MLWYGVEETYSIDVHKVTENGELLVIIKYGFTKTCYLNRLHMLNIVTHCFAF